MTVPIEVFSREEASRYLGISVSKLDKMRDAGELAATPIGRRVLYRKNVLDRYLDRKTRITK